MRHPVCGGIFQQPITNNQCRVLGTGHWLLNIRFPNTYDMIRKLAAGGYRLYSRKKNPRTGKRRNLGTFKTLAAAQKHEREVQYFKRAG